MRILFTNKKVEFNYQFEDKLVVGIVLKGWEVKSIQNNQFNFTDAFVVSSLKEGLVLKNAQISSYKHGQTQSTLSTQADRILLATKQQIKKLLNFVGRPGYTIIVWQVFISDGGLLKLEIALAKGKKQYQKKDIIKNKDIDRQLKIDLKNTK